MTHLRVITAPNELTYVAENDLICFPSAIFYIIVSRLYNVKRLIRRSPAGLSLFPARRLSLYDTPAKGSSLNPAGGLCPYFPKGIILSEGG